MTKSLEARIGRLEAVEEIRVLKARYADVCDTGYDPERMAPFFTDDAVWDGGERFGRYEGLDAIRGFFAGVSSQITWALHYMVAPVDRGGRRPRDGNRELVPLAALHRRRRARPPGRLADRALRRPLPPGGGRLEVLRGRPGHPDGEPVRGRVGAPAVLAPRRRWLGDRNSAGERAGGLASGSSSQCSRSKIPSRFEGVAARGRLLGRCRDEAPSRWS